MPQQPPSPSPSPSPSLATAHAHALTSNSPNSIAKSSPSSTSRPIVTPTAASTATTTIPTPTPTLRRKRPLAKRSCSNCREKKARCELPDIHVPSSKQPVAEAKRCHRCNVLDIDCVVWDGDRKRKPKPRPLTTLLEDVSGLGNASKSTSTSPSPSGASRSSLSELAQVAEIMGASESTLASVSSSLSYLVQYTSKPVGVGLTSPVSDPFFKVWSDVFLRASAPGGSDTIAPERQTYNPSLAHGHVAHPSLQYFSQLDFASLSVQKQQVRSRRYLLMTMCLIMDHALQQPQYTRYLMNRVSLTQHRLRPISVVDMIHRQECIDLQLCMTPYLAWHPHLRSLLQMYDLNQQRPTKSSSFLLASMFLVAARHRHPLSSALMKSLSSAVDMLGSQVILSSTYDLFVVQALELLLAQDPSLIGTSLHDSSEEQAQRGHSLSGHNLLHAAIAASRELGIDKSAATLAKLLAVSSRSAAEESQIPELILCCSLWTSLRIWEGYFVFLKATCGVLRDLDELVETSKCMIAVDGVGNKISGSPVSAEGISASTLASHEVDSERKLRSAGRTNLAYRLQTMAIVQRTLASMEDIIATAKSETQSPTTGRFEVNDQRQDKIVELALSAMQEQAQIDEYKQLDMAPFALYNPANLVEEWSQIESKHLMSILCTFSTGSIASGHILEAGMSPRHFIQILDQDQRLWDRTRILGQRRLDLCEKVVSSFVFFNRRLTITSTPEILKLKNLEGVLEVTGAPVFLSCALVVDACKLFLEGVAFVLVKYSTIQNNYDARLMSMMQAAQRLEEMDGNRYEENNADEQGDVAQKPPRSIFQVSAHFIRDMVETLQKWKLASSIYRRPGVVTNTQRTEPKPCTSSTATAPGAPESEKGKPTSDASIHGRSMVGAMPQGYAPTATMPPMLYSQPPAQQYYSSNEQFGYPAPGPAQFSLQPQLWPTDMNNARYHGQLETPMFPGGAAGTSSAPGAPTTDGAFHAPLFDNFFESFFPNQQ
ncbi:hypothetical protein CPB97_000824 [Podila verticillata]|nr:hypothetical protein CPB97_000824 [Podila verticillata]